MSAKRTKTGHHDGPGTGASASKRQKTNGYSQTQTQYRASISSSSQEGKEGAIDKLRAWLDKRAQDPKVENIFNVTTYPLPIAKKGRKRKQQLGPTEQLSLGGKDHMAVAYTISNPSQWNRLLRFKKFTLPFSETYTLGSCILVNHGESNNTDSGTIDPASQWKAQVLDIRAIDETHVYLRVVWLENPHELPMGPAKYHAKNELVVSNEMGIVEAMAVNGGFKITYWDETDDAAPLPDPDEYFWRQQYDKHTGQLSKLREICACKEPHNPSETIVRCNNCEEWLHANCIVLDAKERASGKSKKIEERGENMSVGKGSKKQDGRKRKSVDADRAEDEKVKVELIVPEDGKPRLKIKDLESGEEGIVREEDVHCLICKKMML